MRNYTDFEEDYNDRADREYAILRDGFGCMSLDERREERERIDAEVRAVLDLMPQPITLNDRLRASLKKESASE